MKKVKLLLGIFCLVLLSACCNSRNESTAECQEGKKKCCASKREMTEEQKAFYEKWQNFDNLPVEEQKELIAQKKACIEKRRAEKKAAIEDFKAKWANFENLTIAEQKELLDNKKCFKAIFGKGMKCCKGKEDKGKCNKEK